MPNSTEQGKIISLQDRKWERVQKPNITEGLGQLLAEKIDPLIREIADGQTDPEKEWQLKNIAAARDIIEGESLQEISPEEFIKKAFQVMKFVGFSDSELTPELISEALRRSTLETDEDLDDPIIEHFTSASSSAYQPLTAAERFAERIGHQARKLADLQTVLEVNADLVRLSDLLERLPKLPTLYEYIEWQRGQNKP